MYPTSTGDDGSKEDRIDRTPAALLQQQQRPTRPLAPKALFLMWMFAAVAWCSSSSSSLSANESGGAGGGDRLLRLKAQKFEDRGAWLEACRCYDDLLRKDRNDARARDGYLRCFRRLQLTTRHADPLYRQTLARLSPSQALETYEQVVSILVAATPDRTRTTFNSLFLSGLQELRLALDEQLFRQQHLPTARPAALNAFKERIGTAMQALSKAPITTRKELREQLLSVIRSASKDGVPLKPPAISAFTMEFAAGACNAVDEYSSFLTPGHMGAIQSALRGKLVGVGLEVGVVNGTLQVTAVYEKSSAAEARLEEGDRIKSVDGSAVDDLLPDVVASRLRGESGKIIELVVESGDATAPNKRTVKLTCRAVAIPSVSWRRLPDALTDGHGAGYIRIRHFQESTAAEVKEALAKLPLLGSEIRGLILDLRGNPGGVFKAAVAVAELFMTEGVVVIGESPFKEYNRPFKVETAGGLQLPLVVLIDGETASAAEVLAGALKEGRPGTKIVGQTSFGKGSVQCIIPMDKAPLERLVGIRLTVARLLSPSGQPYTGRGITPDHRVELGWHETIEEAAKRLLELIQPSTPPMMPMPMMMADGRTS